LRDIYVVVQIVDWMCCKGQANPQSFSEIGAVKVFNFQASPLRQIFFQKTGRLSRSHRFLALKTKYAILTDFPLSGLCRTQL
jgi:hypothetical protein